MSDTILIKTAGGGGGAECYVEDGSGDGHLSPKEPRWGTWKGAHLPGSFERWVKRGLCKWSVSRWGNTVRVNWRECSFTGDPGGYVKGGSGDGHLFP